MSPDAKRPVGADILPTSATIAPVQLKNPADSQALETPSDELDRTRIVAEDDRGGAGKRWYELGHRKEITLVVLVLILIAAVSFAISSLSGNSKNNQGTDLNKSNFANLDGLAGSLAANQQNAKLRINYNTEIAAGKTFTANGPVIVQNDSTGGFKVQGPDGSNLLVADTTNGRVGIGGLPTGVAKLQVNGNLSINGQVFSTAGAYSLSNQGLTLNGVLVCTSAGCVSQQNLTNVVTLAGNNNFTGLNKFTAAGNVFVGDGSGISALDAGNVTAGTLSDSRLSNNVALVNGNNSFTGSNSFASLIQANSGIDASAYSVSGTAGANISCAPGYLLQQPTITGGIITAGSCIQVAGGSTPTLQQVYDSSTPASIVLSSASGALQIQDAATPLGTDLFEVTNNGGGTKYFTVTASGATVGGTLNATTLQQNGVGVLDQNTNFSGDVAGTYNSLAIGVGAVNSSKILDGTIANADISGTAAIAYSKLNLAGNIVNADINAGASISYSKLNLSGSVTNSDISGTAAITYSKLSLNNSIVNSDISTTAAIAYSKLNLTGSIQDGDVSGSSHFAFTNAANTFTAAQLIKVDDAGALQIQDSSSDHVLTVDTLANKVSINTLNFAGTGNVAQAITKSMVVSSAVNAHDIVIIDTASPGEVATTNVAKSNLVYGVATTTNLAGQTQDIVIGGTYQVNVDATSTIAVGDFIATSSTPGQVTTNNNPAAGTILGRALSAVSTPGAGQTVWVQVTPDVGGGTAGSGVTTIGTLDGQAKSADGALIAGTTLYMQTADASEPGLVSTAAQTFAGDKTFNGVVNATTLQQGGTGVLLQSTNFSGDLSGTYNSTSVDKLKGTALSISALANTNLLIYNSTSGTWENHSISGDITVNNSGVASIGVGKVTSSNILDGTIANADVSATAGITYSKLNLTGSIQDGDVSGSSHFAFTNANQTFTGDNVFQLLGNPLAVEDAASPLGTNLFEVTDHAGTTKYFEVSAAGAKVNGNDVCTAAGNCTGVSGGAIGGSGTAGKIAKFTGSGFTVGDSLISDNGTSVTVGGALAVNTITPTATLTVGTPTQTLTLQGDASTSLKATAGGVTNSLVFASPTVSGKTITLPNASGTVAVSASGPLSLDAAGNLTCPTCLTSGGGGTAGVTDVNGANGSITLAGTAHQIIITPSSGTFTFSTPQDIDTTSSVSFANVNVSGNLQTNNTTRVDNAGNLTNINNVDVSGSVANKAGTDFSAVGSSNDVNFGNVSLVRLTGASAQTITGIAGGRDGYQLTIVNAGTQAAIIANNSASSLAANRITTGTGADYSLPVGSGIGLVYDATASLWRLAATGTGINSIGTIDTQGPSADGATIVGNSIYLQSASASANGLVSTTTQTFAGDKTFSGLITGQAGLSVSGGAVTLQGNAASSLTTTSGALTLQGAAGTSLLTANAAGAASSNITISSGNVTSGAFASGNVTIDVGTATGTTGTISIGTANASAVSIGLAGKTTTVNGALSVSQTLTSTGLITANGGISVAAGQTVLLNGGNTASRPASPTAGTLYYDTSTNQLIKYNGAKWVSAPKSNTFIVAASNSTQSEKDAADYVATGTGDQATINSALSALPAGGGSVYLMEGTYYLSAAISVPNNTTLEGAGAATIITIPNAQNGTYNMIQNTDTTTGTNVVIQNLLVDGNVANQSSGNMVGIKFDHVGNSSRTGGKVRGVTVQNLYGTNAYGIFESNSGMGTVANNTLAGDATGIYLQSTSDTSLVGNVSNSNSSYGIELTGNTSVRNNITGNTTYNNSKAGIYMGSFVATATVSGNTLSGNGQSGIQISSNDSYISVTGNAISNNATYGMFAQTSSNLTFSGNAVINNSGYGIYLQGVTGTSVADNKLDSNGGAGNNAIYLTSSSMGNSITGNHITDTVCSSSCYAINISDSGSTGNYIASNYIQGDGTHSASIQDSTTSGNTYSNQEKTENGDASFRNGTNSGTAFQIQNAAGVALLTADTSAGKVALGTAGASGLTGNLKFNYSGSTGSISIVPLDPASGTYTINLPAENGTICTTGSVCTGYQAAVAGGAANQQLSNLSGTVAINQSLAPNADNTLDLGSAADSWRTLYADTSVLTPTLDTGSAIALNLGTTNATVINLNKNTALAAGKSLTITGGNTASRPASPTAGTLYYDTTTNQLIKYNGTKWVSAPKSNTFIVAASNSTQAEKDAADYVATGTGDQATINSALTALPAGGGSVYLMEGTYTLSASISVPNNVTLAGSGASTIVTIANAFNTALNFIVNTDTTTGTNVTVQNLLINGNKAGQTLGTSNGIVFSGLGNGTVRTGGKVYNVTVQNMFGGSGMSISGSNNIVANNIATNNAASGIAIGSGVNDVISGNLAYANTTNGITVSSQINASITGNTSYSNTQAGIQVSGGTGATISGNTANTNTTAGIFLNATNGSTVTGNTTNSDSAYGIELSASGNDVISSNKLDSTGGASHNNAIYLQSGSTKNTISGNGMVDGSCTADCYAINISDSGSIGNYLSGNYFQGDGTHAASITDATTGGNTYANQPLTENGDASFRNGTNSGTAFQIQNAAGTSLFTADTTGSGALTLAANVTANAKLDVVGSEATKKGADYATTGLSIDTNFGSTSLVRLTGASTQTIAGIANGRDGYRLTIINAAAQSATLKNNDTTDETTAANLIITGNGSDLSLAAGASVSLVYDSGSSVWRAIGTSSAGGATATLQQSYDASTTSPQITLDSSPGANGLVIQDASSPLGTNLFTVQSNGGSTKFLQVAATGVTVNNLTSTGVITANGGISVAANQTITLAGGNTASRPASPTKGMLYFDTTTNQLLQYNGTKWVSAPRSNTEIVAAAGSTQAEKDAADFVATGTGDQTTINAAFAALPSGLGSVYLMEGIYYLSGSIYMPSATTLSGAGANTGITIPNGQNGTYSMITNQFMGNVGDIIQNLTINGNKAGQGSGSMIGIAFSDAGAATGTYDGGKISNVIIDSMSGRGIYLTHASRFTIENNTLDSNGGSGIDVYSNVNGNSSDVTIANNIITGSGINGISVSGNNMAVVNNNVSGSYQDGININGAANAVVTGNMSGGNGLNGSAYGIDVFGSPNASVTGNTVQGNPMGIQLDSANNSTVSSNSVNNNSLGGVVIHSSSNNNITANRITNSGGTDNEGIYVDSSSKNSITNNNITDTSCTTSCYAIDIDDSGSTGNYLSANYFLGDGTNAASINDIGTGTVYSSQSRTSSGDASFRNGTNSATAFQIQNAAGSTIFNVDTTNGIVGTAATSAGSTNSNNFVLQTGNATGLTSNSGNVTIDVGTATGTTGAISIGTANASAVSIGLAGKTTTVNGALSVSQTLTSTGLITANGGISVAANQTITMAGGATGSRPASPTKGTLFYDTTTNQLVQYNGTKWQAPSKSNTFIVAASNSTQAEKDAADYVATGTNDETTINTALAALPAGGGSVYLMEGTYTIGTTGISMPNNTTLTGSGSGTLVQLKQQEGVGVYYAIANSGNTGITIENLRLDGNRPNQSNGTVYGIYFNGVGSCCATSGTVGGKVSNVSVNNFAAASGGYGIYLNNSYNNIISNASTFFAGNYGIYVSGSGENTITSNFTEASTDGIYIFNSTDNAVTGNTAEGNSIGILVSGGSENNISGNSSYNNNSGLQVSNSSNNTLTGNTSSVNSSYGIQLFNSNGSTVTGNTTVNNVYGIGLTNSSNNGVSGNSSRNNSNYGVYLSGSSNNNISGNKVYDNGGATANQGIVIASSSNQNSITSNDITDSSCTSTCKAIDVISGTSNYLSGNHFIGDGTNPASINNGGTSTILSGQELSETGDASFRNGTDSATAFQVQNSSSRSLLGVDTSSSKVTIGNTTDGSQISLAASGNANAVITKNMPVGGTVNAHDLVVIDSSTNGQVKTTTTANDTKVFGIATGSGTPQDIVISGTYQVNLLPTNQAISPGDYLVSTTTAGDVDKASGVPPSGTAIGEALESKAANTGGTIWVYVTPGAGGTGVGSSTTLQQAYDFSTGGTTPEIKVSTTGGGVDIQDADTTIASSLFTVRGSNGSGLGTAIFDIQSTGAIALTPTTASSTITIGSTSQTGAITIGQSTASNTINIGTSENTGTQGINIGTSIFGITNTLIGSAANSSNTAIRAGSGGLGLFVSGTSTGGIVAKTITNSTAAFQIQNSTASSLLTANTVSRAAGTSGNIIKIGSNAGTDVGTTVLVADSYAGTLTTNLSSLNGGLYYNSSTGHINIIENGVVKEVCNKTDALCGGNSTTLQQAYDASTAGTTPEIVIGAVTNTTGVDIQNKAGASVTGASLFAVRDKAANNTTLGTALFNVSDKGEVTVQTTTNSTTALQVLNQNSNSLLTVDTQNSKVNAGGSSGITLWSGIAGPSSPTATFWNYTSYALPGTAGVTYYYKATSINSRGEGLPGVETSIPTSSFTPVTAPGAPTATVNATSGNLNGSYLYKITYVTPNGETTGGVASSAVTPAAQQVNLTFIPTASSIYGVTARKIYRSNDGGTTYKLVTTLNDNVTTSYTDNIADASLGAAVPTVNTATTNSNEVRVSWTAVSGAVSYNVYRGTSPGGENIFVGNTTGTSIFDTGSVTAGALPTNDTSGGLGLGTTSAPTATLDVNGSSLFQLVNSTTAFQVQNAAGSNLLSIDSTNSMVKIGQSSGAPTWHTQAIAATYPNATCGSQDSSAVTSNGSVYVFAYSGALCKYNTSTASWSSLATDPNSSSGRMDINIVTYNGKIYVWGGVDTASMTIYYNTLDIYDIASNTWSTGTAGGTARYNYSSAVYNGKMYIWGGYNGSILNTVDIYDFTAGTWSTGTAGGTARYGNGAALYNGKMYLYGGHTGAGVSNTMDIYDLSADTWSTGVAGPTARAGIKASVHNGSMYVYAGASGSLTTDVYNFNTSSWSTTSGLSGAGVTSNYAEAVDDTHLYIIGGAYNGSSSSNQFYIYNFDSSVTPNQPQAPDRVGGTSVIYNGKMYVCGGYQTDASSSAITSLDIYDLAAGTWSSGTSGCPGYKYSSSVIYNGKMYVYGGFSYFGAATNGLKIYDLSAGTWSTGTAGGTARGAQSATVYNGKMYVWGGATSDPALGSGSVLNTVDIYDFTAGTWSTGTAGGTARAWPDEAIYNGKMYETGGTNANKSSYYNTVDIYDFTAGTWSTGTAGGTARAMSTSSLVGSKLYIWGGTASGSSNAINTVDIYDVSANTWSTGTAGGTARSGHVGVAYNNALYSWAGVPSSGSSSPLTTMDVYDINGQSPSAALVLSQGAFDPTGQVGSIYFNADTNKLRCYGQNTGWVDCNSTSTSTPAVTSLATAYNSVGTAGNTITYTTAGAGIVIQDAVTPLPGNLLTIQNNAGTNNYLTLNLASGTPTLKVYDSTGANYASISYSGGAAIFAASSGVTQIGSSAGGPINFVLANDSDYLKIDHTTSLTASIGTAYSDVLINRSLTQGAFNSTGSSVLKVQDNSSTSGGIIAPDVVVINQNNGSATGNVLNVQTGGASIFSVANGGNVNAANNISIGAGKSYTGSGAVTVASAAGAALSLTGNANSTWSTASGTLTVQGAGGLTLGTGAGGAINIGPTNATSIILGGNSAATITEKVANSSATAYQLQTAGGTSLVTANTTASVIQIGSATTDGTAYVLGLDSYNETAGTPTVVNGGMYFDSVTGSFRCGENGAWFGCAGGLVNSSTATSNALTLSTSDQSFNGGTNNSYTVLANDCQAGVVYNIIASGTWTATSTTPAVSLFLDEDGTTTHLLSTGTGVKLGTASTTAGWQLNAQMICDSTTAAEIQGTVLVGTNGSGAATAETLTNTGTKTWSASNHVLTIGMLTSSTTGAPSATMRQFIVQRMAP